MFSHVALTVQSLCSIQAFGQQQYMRDEFVQMLDTHTGFWFLFVATSRSLGALVDLIVASFQIAVILLRDVPNNWVKTKQFSF